MKKYSRIKKFETLIRPLSWYIFVLTKARIKVIIQLLRLKPPCLMDICFEAIRLTSCKYPSDRALRITFFNGLNNYKLFIIPCYSFIFFKQKGGNCKNGSDKKERF